MHPVAQMRYYFYFHYKTILSTQTLLLMPSESFSFVAGLAERASSPDLRVE